MKIVLVCQDIISSIPLRMLHKILELKGHDALSVYLLNVSKYPKIDTFLKIIKKTNPDLVALQVISNYLQYNIKLT